MFLQFKRLRDRIPAIVAVFHSRAGRADAGCAMLDADHFCVFGGKSANTSSSNSQYS